MRSPSLVALALLACVACVGACSSDDSSAPAGTASGGSAGGSGAGGGASGASGAGLGDWDPTPVGGDRPTKVYVPSSYAGQPMPLVVLLHGYGASGGMQELLFKLEPEAEKRGYLYVHPDGTKDKDNLRFWNATPVCCDFQDTKVDDVAYLSGLVAEIGTRWKVDPARVYFLGHSNGAFMSYRMACQKPGLVAGIGVLAGMMNLADGACPAPGPVNVVHLHGDIDDVVPMNGGPLPKGNGLAAPSAMQSVGAWAAKDGCAAMPEEYDTVDLETTIAGAETHRAKFPGCGGTARVELWTLSGAGHIPDLSGEFAPKVLDVLMGK